MSDRPDIKFTDKALKSIKDNDIPADVLAEALNKIQSAVSEGDFEKYEIKQVGYIDKDGEIYLFEDED